MGKDFNEADKGRKFSKGGDMASKMNPGFMAMMDKKKSAKPSKVAPTKKLARGGGVESKGKTKGSMVKMMKGGKC